jgi:THO complex subunit 2
VDCIETGEFMHLYNAIIVLKEILPVFPSKIILDVGQGAIHKPNGKDLDQAMDKLIEHEERGDLKILARA